MVFVVVVVVLNKTHRKSDKKLSWEITIQEEIMTMCKTMFPASNINLVCEKTLDLTGFRKNLTICIFKSVPQ